MEEDILCKRCRQYPQNCECNHSGRKEADRVQKESFLKFMKESKDEVVKEVISDWDKKFLDTTELFASWSKDRSRKVGATIVRNNHVIASGYNGFPVGCNDDIDARHAKPAKYMYTEHAERNAIYSAAKAGISTEGTTMYLQWFPCSDCARAIIQSGIKAIVCTEPDLTDKNWGEHFRVSKEILEEVGIKITYYK